MRGLNIYLPLNAKAGQEKLDLLRCGNPAEWPRGWGREPGTCPFEGCPSEKAGCLQTGKCASKEDAVKTDMRLGVSQVQIPRPSLSWIIRSHLVIDVSWLQCTDNFIRRWFPFFPLLSNWVSTLVNQRLRKEPFQALFPSLWVRRKRVLYFHLILTPAGVWVSWDVRPLY